MFAVRRLQPASLTIRGIRFSSGASSHGHSGDPKEIEHEKQKTLKGQNDSPMDHAPGWNEKLASDSEAKVKATKDKRGPEELQKDTAAKLEKEHPGKK